MQETGNLSETLAPHYIARPLMIGPPSISSSDSYFTGASDVTIRLNNTAGDFSDSNEFVGKQAQLWGLSNGQRRLIVSGHISAQVVTLTDMTLTVSSIPIEALEESLPKRTITEELFPTSQAIGTNVPIVFGRVLRHACPNISIGYESTLSSSAATSITLDSVIGIAIGDRLAVGVGTNNQEDVKVSAVVGNTVTVSALSNSHSSGDVVTSFDNLYDYLLGEGEYSEDQSKHFTKVARVYHEDRALPELVSDTLGSLETLSSPLELEDRFTRPLEDWYENFVIDFFNGDDLQGSLLIKSYDTDDNEIAFDVPSGGISYDSYRLREYRFFDGSQDYPYPGYAFIRFAVKYTGEIRADVEGFDITNPFDFIESLFKDDVWGAGVDNFNFSTADQMTIGSYKTEGAITQETAISQLVEEVGKLLPLRLSNPRNMVTLELREVDHMKQIDTGLGSFLEPPTVRFLPISERSNKVTVNYRLDGSTGEYISIDTADDADFVLGDVGTENVIDLPFVYEKETADRVLYREGKRAESQTKVLECAVNLSSLIDSDGVGGGRGLGIGEKVSFADDTLTAGGEDWEVQSIEEDCRCLLQAFPSPVC